jgi:hypothetical protein
LAASGGGEGVKDAERVELAVDALGALALSYVEVERDRARIVVHLRYRSSLGGFGETRKAPIHAGSGVAGHGRYLTSEPSVPHGGAR